MPNFITHTSVLSQPSGESQDDTREQAPDASAIAAVSAAARRQEVLGLLGFDLPKPQ